MPQSLFDQLTVGGKYTIGIDGASANVLPHDSAMQWETARLQGIQYMMWRLGVGLWADPSFVANMVEAGKQGIKNRAGYIVIWPTTSTSGHMDTILFNMAKLAEIEGPDVQPPTLMLDVERKAENDVMQLLRRFFKPGLVNTRVIQVADRILALQDGLEPIYYTNYDYVTSYMGSAADKKYLTRFKGRVFIANYGNKFEKSAANEKPLMPAPLKDESLPMDGATWHQFTANENRLGRLFGYEDSHAIDISRTLLKDEELALAFGGREFEPPDPPAPEPPIEPEPQGIPERILALENKQQQIAGEIRQLQLKVKGLP